MKIIAAGSQHRIVGGDQVQVSLVTPQTTTTITVYAQ